MVFPHFFGTYPHVDAVVEVDVEVDVVVEAAVVEVDAVVEVAVVEVDVVVVVVVVDVLVVSTLGADPQPTRFADTMILSKYP